jgi:hypothetical protein
MTLTKITGNTYPVKDQLRALGGKWNPTEKCWEVSSDKAAEAQKLVADAPAAAPLTPGKCRKCGAQCKAPYTLCWDCKPAPTACQVCGKRADRYTRIYRSGECGDCYEERKMGY